MSGRTGAAPGGHDAATRPGGVGPGPRGGGHGMMGMGMPVAKPKNFRQSFRRLIGRLRPEAPLIVLVVVLAVVSVSFAVIGPKILGNATNDIFQGLISKNLPAGVTQDQAIAALRAKGQNQVADMLSSMHLTPGHGVDFGALGQVLLLLAGVYLLSSLFSWGQAYIMAGVTQRTVYRLRRETDEKLGRLPLKYFDGHPRGDVLSRVTNDIDNIGQTLQQSLTQLITSLLTVVGVLILTLTISPILAVLSLLAVPVSIVVTVFIASRSQKQFVAQWASTGALNGHVEEMHTGHSIVKVFGRQEEAIAQFNEENDRLYEASYRAQFISGIIQPAM
ncbi:MAG: ABC transporter permease, partial [Candidatus Limnocylindrales bacterium]